MQIYRDHILNGFFMFSEDFISEIKFFDHIPETIHLIFNFSNEEVLLTIDDIHLVLNSYQGLAYTYRQKIHFTSQKRISGLSFNRAFYCIVDHDEEVSCTGLLFFGRTTTMPFSIPEVQKTRFLLLLDILQEEFQTEDKIQGEMLRVLLKRMIILCTRLVKVQHFSKIQDEKQMDIVRKFNILVEHHYKHHKRVSDYAAMMFKSPKTITNAFSAGSEKSALTTIHERVIFESKKMLLHSEFTVKEIAAELGYSDPNHFNKLFKMYTGTSPRAFRRQE